MELSPLWRWVCILSTLGCLLTSTTLAFSSLCDIPAESPHNDSIRSLLSSLPELEIFNRALLKSNLRTSLLHKEDPQTFFVPNNAAFKKVIEDSLLTCVDDFYLANPCTSVDHILRSTNLDKLVRNHVVEGIFEVNSRENGTLIQFIGDAVVEIETVGEVIYVGNAVIVLKYTATDGILYVVDNVLGSKNPDTLLSSDVSFNETTVLGATKLSDAGFFSLAKRQEMAESVQLVSIPAFQLTRNVIGYQDGGLFNPPALTFDPSLHDVVQGVVHTAKFNYPVLDNVKRPAAEEDLAFMTLGHGDMIIKHFAVRSLKKETRGRVVSVFAVLELGALIRTKQVSSQELVQLYTERLKRDDAVLKAVITYTTELAFEQALEADNLLAKGIYLGPLHGIPYGLKDLIAVPKYKTTWGCKSFKNQVIDEEAWVYRRLKAAGAVLIAKVVTGSLAYNDIWFGGQTKNPWNIAEGSTGSSSGSAACTSAGNLPFAIGSETEGSITLPASRTGTTAIRPTFGMVGRSWVMTLSPSLDKIGPFCRSATDCAVILDIIRGRDPDDMSSKDIQLKDPFKIDVTKLVVGYLPDADMEVVNVLASRGVEMVKFDFDYKVTSAQAIITDIMDVDVLSNFDHWQRSGLDDEYEAPWQWPLELRRARLISAVDYVQALRARNVLQRTVQKSMKEAGVDAFIGNASDWEKVCVGNLVGMPVMIVPTGLKNISDPPIGGTNRRTTITTGIYAAPYHDGEVLALAMAYQEETRHHLARPPVGNVGPHDPLQIAEINDLDGRNSRSMGGLGVSSYRTVGFTPTVQRHLSELKIK